YKIANEPAPDIRMVRNDVSPQLAAVVAQALTKKSDERYQDGDKFAADLLAVLAQMQGAGAQFQATAPLAATGAAAAAPAADYDATQKMQATPGDAFEKTAAFTKTSASGPAPDTGGRPDLEL
ncbi:MAG: hypothetical protein Q8N17_25090, partial [Burkholderiaceae bacterium]|nr:hypothetical protein [Burkholderiaceae bacterium]